MSKIGEYPIQRSDGDWDYIDIHAQGTFNEEPVLVQLSDGTWGAPNVRPLGDGNTGLLVQASDGTWYQMAEQAISVIEDWESATFDNWGGNQNINITQDRTFEGDWAIEAMGREPEQKVFDNEREHGNLPRYQDEGDTVRVYAYFDEVPDGSQGNAFIRWGFGGIHGDPDKPAIYAHWNINDQGLHIRDSDRATAVESGYGFSYSGHDWWALETEWQPGEVFARLIDYSDRNNPTTEVEISTTDIGNLTPGSPLGHYWYVWNQSVYNLYSDYAIITSD